MGLLWLAAILIYSFGAIAFGNIFALWVREFLAARRSRARGEAVAEPAFLVDGAISLASVLWFATAVLSTVLATRETGTVRWMLDSGFLAIGLLYPPLIMHSVYTPSRVAGRLTGRAWKSGLVATYVASQSISAFCLLGFWNVLPLLPPSKLVGLVGAPG